MIVETGGNDQGGAPPLATLGKIASALRLGPRIEKRGCFVTDRNIGAFLMSARADGDAVLARSAREPECRVFRRPGRGNLP